MQDTCGVSVPEAAQLPGLPSTQLHALVPASCPLPANFTNCLPCTCTPACCCGCGWCSTSNSEVNKALRKCAPSYTTVPFLKGGFTHAGSGQSYEADIYGSYDSADNSDSEAGDIYAEEVRMKALSSEAVPVQRTTVTQGADMQKLHVQSNMQAAALQKQYRHCHRNKRYSKWRC